MVYDSTVYRQPYAIQGIEDVPADMSSLFVQVESIEPLHLYSFFIPKFDGGGIRKARDPRARILRYWFKKVQSSGRCLCLHPEFLVWLDEEYKERHMEYGTIRRVIPLSHIQLMEIEYSETGQKRSAQILVRLQWQGAESNIRIPIDLERVDSYLAIVEQWRQLKSREYRFL